MYCRKSGKQKNHNHGSQYELWKKLELINSIKKEVITAPKKRSNVREIFEEQCKKFKEEVSQTIQYRKMRRNLLLIKQKNLPQSPKSFPSIIDAFNNENVMIQYGMSKIETGKQFYVDTIITDDIAYSIFVSPTILNAILSMSSSDPRNYLFDSTRYAVPAAREFKQILIIHIVHGEQTFPFAYILMSNKRQVAYEHVLQYLKSNVLNLQPKNVITNYGNNLRNAIKKTYPTAEIVVGCWYHYTNALRRNALKIPGFQKYLNMNNQAKEIFNKFLYLPLLKPRDIIAAFEILKADARSLKKVKEENSQTSANYLELFINYYFESQWIEKEKAQNFSVYYTPIRKNFHNEIHLKLPNHGHFFKFVDFLRDFDAAKSSDYTNSISACTSLFPNEVLESRYHLYERNTITLNNFLTELSKTKNCMIEEDFINKTFDDDDDESDENEISVIDTFKMYPDSSSCVNHIETEKKLQFDPLEIEHFKACQQCYQRMKENSKQKKQEMEALCSICGSTDENSILLCYSN